MSDFNRVFFVLSSWKCTDFFLLRQNMWRKVSWNLNNYYCGHVPRLGLAQVIFFCDQPFSRGLGWIDVIVALYGRPRLSTVDTQFHGKIQVKLVYFFFFLSVRPRCWQLVRSIDSFSSGSSL